MAGSTTTYLYNALGQRVKKSGGVAGTVLMVYDEAGHLLGEYNGTGGLVQETVWLGDIPVATLRPGTPVGIFYVHTNHLNTPVAVTRPSDNKLRWQWHPDAFGAGAPNENPQALGAFKYNLRFPGQYYDQETGQYYNYFRDYDSLTGRYVESDPVGLRGGSFSTYSYAGNNSVMFYDPTGLLCTYSQLTGDLTCTNDITGQQYVHCVGYSGIGAGLNNPDAQITPFFGPLPRGDYLVGYPTNRKGPLTLPLFPAPYNNMYGRNGFLIHGDNRSQNQTASNGCIVANHDCRASIPPTELLRVTW